MNSFSNILNDEILSKKLSDKNDILAELYGIFYSKNCFIGDEIVFKTELKSIFERIKYNLDMLEDIDYSYNISTKKNTLYVFNIKNIEFDYNKLNQKNILKGFYLASGYLNDPKKTYSIDFFVDNDNGAKILYEILINNGKRVHLITKKNTNIVYVRNMEDILDIIIMLDATNTFFKYEDITINKEISMKITRNINYELANETKKIINSDNQIKMIKEIFECNGFNKLTEVLKNTAIARLENEDMSLQQLSDHLKITKSGLRNRFRRLKEVYDELKSKK